MPKPVTRGKPDCTEQAKQRTWTDDNGWVTTRTYVGPESPSLNKIIDDATTSVPPACVSCSVAEGDVWKVTIQTQDGKGGTADQECWELCGNDLEKPLKTHPDFAKDKAGAKILQAILQIEHDLEDAEKDVANINYDNTYSTTAANDYRDLRLQGVESYLTTQWVIRQTKTCSSKSTFTIGKKHSAKVGVDMVDTPPVPKGLPFDLPDGEWLKKAPQVRKSGGLTEICTEWWHAEKWSQLLYGGSAIP